MLISEIPIYCINLHERPERKQNAIQELEKIHIDKKNVIFLEFHKHKKGGCYGCYDSHLKIWHDFYHNHKDKEMCIIFEDDVEVTENSKMYLKRAIPFIEKNKDEIDLLFLHDKFIKATQTSTKRHVNNKYFTNGYGICTHAYIITRKFIKSILKKNNNMLPEPDEFHFDFDININKNSKLYTEKNYFCNEHCFTQIDDQSNNYMNNLDKIIRLTTTSDYMQNIGVNIVKNTKLLCNLNDTQTKKLIFFLNNVYSIN